MTRQSRRSRGWSLPIINILIVIIAVLVWFFGWIVLVWVAGLFAVITAGVALDDWVRHDTKCSYCRMIREIVAGDNEISQDGIKTRHLEKFADRMTIRVFIDGKPDVFIEMDYNGEITAYLPGPE